MIHEAVIALAVAVALVISFVLFPPVARCPAGWSLGEGIRLTGEYACYTPPLPRGCHSVREPWFPCEEPTIARGRIYCTGGSIPIVVDERTVGCTMRHR